MIKLYYSNDTRYLARLLSQNLEQERSQSPAALFHTARVIVQNVNVKSYLKLEIAKTSGIFANVQFPFLEEFLDSLLPPDTVLADRKLTHYLLVQYFMEQQGSFEKLPAEVAAYLGSPGHSSGNSGLWIYQLADRLAKYYQDYSFARPHMVEQWQQGKLSQAGIKDSGARDTEQWQQKVWSAIFGPGGKVEAVSKMHGRQYHSLSSLPQQLAKKGLRLPDKVHLFGFSYLYQNHNLILEQLSSRMDICIYTVNPCMEFWEDVLTPAEAAALKQRYLALEKRKRGSDEPGHAEEEGGEDPYHLADPTENEFLQRWGRPGRENIHILNDMASSDFYSGFIDPLERGYSLLRKIQHDILLRTIKKSEPFPPEYKLEDDSSLRILMCPEIRREVEIIANEIWDLVRENNASKPATASDRLRFNEIAVIIANTAEYDTYTTHIASVFHDIHDIPHTIADLSPKTSRVVEAIEMLLSLPVNPINRSALLGLLTHPSFLSRFPEADAGEWTAWCNGLAIFHGESSEDHKDTYIEKDLYNWDQGMRRLALGAFLEGERSNEERPFVAENGMAYLPQDISQGSYANAARFIALVRSLLADCSFARSSSLSIAEWAAFTQAFIKTYLKAETPEDERTMAMCLGKVAALSRLDVEKKQISYAMAQQFASASLQSVTLSRGTYLAHGVVVSSFLPMRPVPFKVVFIAGMGEGCFPAREMRDPLDLRNARRMKGDVTPRERDQYNFLETLVSTRDRLRLSYVSRDSQTGEPLEASSIIKELNYILEQRYNLTVDQAKSLAVQHPLRRYDSQYFPALFGAADRHLPNYSLAALREAQAVKLKQGLSKLLMNGEGIADAQTLEQYGRERLGSFLYPFAAPASAPPSEEKSVSVPLYAIRKFLECPLQGWAGFNLRLREDESEDLLANVDEIFSTARYEGMMRQRKAFAKSRGIPDGWSVCERNFEQELALDELKGAAPTGIFLEIEKRKHLADMRLWQANWELVKMPDELAWKTVRFGTTGEHQDIDLKFPAVQLQAVRPGPGGALVLNIELTGTISNITADFTRCFRLTNKTGTVMPKDFLPVFLDYMVLLASGNLGAGGFEAAVLSMNGQGEEEARVRRLVFTRGTQEDAKAYLSLLISEMLFGSHAYLLPVEAVVKHRWDNKNGSSLSGIIDDMKETFTDKNATPVSSQRGPVAHPEDYCPPEDADAARMVEERFGRWFKLMPVEWK